MLHPWCIKCRPITCCIVSANISAADNLNEMCLQWLDQHVISAGPASYTSAGMEPDPFARPQSVPPGTMLAGRLATWPDTAAGQQHGDNSNSLATALAALNQGRPSPFEGFAASNLAPPPPAAPGSWDTRSFSSAAAAAVEDPIKQVQMRFRARSSSAMPALPPPPPRPQHHQGQFASLSFPVQATYLAAAGSEEQQQQQLTPRFQSVSQDSVVGQYRQHVSPPAMLVLCGTFGTARHWTRQLARE